MAVNDNMHIGNGRGPPAQNGLKALPGKGSAKWGYHCEPYKEQVLDFFLIVCYTMKEEGVS